MDYEAIGVRSTELGDTEAINSSRGFGGMLLYGGSSVLTILFVVAAAN
jgi:hypothetical protein